MRVLIAGASGLIGTELVRQLSARGDTVARLVRREATGTNEFRWDPAAGRIDPAALTGVDAVINLSGASLARLPWTKKYRAEILNSRVQATRTLVTAMNSSTTPPGTLLNASGIGVYGSRPGELLTEESSAGSDFLAEVVKVWEHEASLAPASTRVVLLRTSLVLAKKGALGAVIPLTKLGLAGPLGKGTHQWAWISLQDEAAAIVHLLNSTLSGPVNLVGPTPATSNDVLKALATELHRPFFLRVPAPILTFLLQDAARQLLLADQHASAAKLLDDGFAFSHRTPAEAVRWMFSRP
jgi:uncharacterized protein (TIGR01777 family)